MQFAQVAFLGHDDAADVSILDAVGFDFNADCEKRAGEGREGSEFEGGFAEQGLDAVGGGGDGFIGEAEAQFGAQSGLGGLGGLLVGCELGHAGAAPQWARGRQPGARRRWWLDYTERRNERVTSGRCGECIARYDGGSRRGLRVGIRYARMTDSVWTSQLRIAGGNAVEDSPQIALAEARDRRGRLVRLFVLAESASPGGDAFIDGFVGRIGEAFDPRARSLTGTLIEVLEGRHEELRQWNREHLPAQQASYGVSCVLLREGEAGILAQAGPSLAVLAGDPPPGGLRELHVRALREGAAAAQPIGGGGALRVQFFPLPVARDGWALLLTSNAQRLIDAAGQANLGQLAVDDVLPNLYPALRELTQAAAMVIGVPGSDPSEAGSGTAGAAEGSAAPAPETPPMEPAPRIDAASASVSVEAESAAPALVERSTESEAAASAPLPAPPPPAPPAGAPEFVFAAPPAPRGSWPTNPFAAVDLSVLAVEAGGVGAAPGWGRPLADLSGELPDPAANRPELESQRKRRGPPLRTTLIALFGMLAVLAAISAALVVPTLLSNGDEQFGARLESARQGLAAAALGVDVASSRASLRQALGDVNLALEDKPLDQQALDLRGEIEAALAELDLLFVPAAFETLVDLGRFGPSIALGAIYLAGAGSTGGGDRLYALDDAGGRVFAIGETGLASVLFSEGAALGAASGAASGAVGARSTGRPISLAPDGAALWVLDSERQLFRIDDAGALLIGMPQAERLGSLDAIAVAGDGLWALDARGGAVWRFPRAAADGALGSPQRMTPRVNLASAIDLAVALRTGGSVEVFVSMDDGRLRRFVDGEESPLTLEGLDRGPLVPASLGVGQVSGLLYLADRGNDRVLVLGPDGGLSHQIAAEELRGLRGVGVDEARGRIVYALADRLLASPLPAAD